MKKTKCLLALMSLVAALLTSCSDDSPNPPDENSQYGFYYRTTVKMYSGDEENLVYTIAGVNMIPRFWGYTVPIPTAGEKCVFSIEFMNEEKLSATDAINFKLNGKELSTDLKVGESVEISANNVIRRISETEMEVSYDPAFWNGKNASDLKIWFEGNPWAIWNGDKGELLPLDTPPTLNIPKRIPIVFHPDAFNPEDPQAMQTHLVMPYKP
ncbi:MAG: hypothetical protein U0L83_04785 [Muribaculaceae bacterium]|nr:hypothetical protein [Muribaculaceae bacterium]